MKAKNKQKVRIWTAHGRMDPQFLVVVSNVCSIQRYYSRVGSHKLKKNFFFDVYGRSPLATMFST